VHIICSKIHTSISSTTSPLAFCNNIPRNYLGAHDDVYRKRTVFHSSISNDGDDEGGDISSRVKARVKELVSENENTVASSKSKRASSKTTANPNKARLARATAALIAKRKEETASTDDLSLEYHSDNRDDDKEEGSRNNIIDLTKKIDQKILANNWRTTGQRRRLNDPSTGTVDATDSMQSLLGYNHFEGEWSDRNSTTYHVAIVFGKPLIKDQVTIEYATRLRTLAKMLKDEPSFKPSLICFTGGRSTDTSAISDASAGYVYFRHLCAVQNITIDDTHTKIWVDDNKSDRGEDERGALGRISSELWKSYIKQWLKDRPLTERLNQHYGVGWTILERKADIHFTLFSTEYHLCNLNDVHHRSPGKSFLQPLVSLRGLVGSDRWQNNDLEVLDPNYSSSVHVSQGSNEVQTSPNQFGGIENSVDTSWSFQYGTYPFLHDEEDAVVFLGQCFLLGEELTPLLVNMRGVVEQTEFFQRDNYLLLSSIRRSLVSLVEALYSDRGQEIRAGVISYFEKSRGINQFTQEDVKIIVVLESALLNLGRCIDLVKPGEMYVSF